MQATVTVKILDGKQFSTGLKYARGNGGKFDGAAKTWTMPITQSVANMLNAPTAYGWRVVSRTDEPTTTGAARCPHWSPESGCPLHGETCNPAYSR